MSQHKPEQLEILLKKCEDDFEECAGVGMNLDMKCKEIQNILRDPFPESIYPQLTALERRIAKLSIDGETSTQMAKRMKIPIGTIRNYYNNIYKATGVKRRRWPTLVFDRIKEVLKDAT